MDDLISREAAIDQAMGKLDYTDVVFDIATEFEIVYMLRSLPSIPAVPLDKLCEFLADTLHTPAPCFNNEEICPHMDFGYCRLPDAPDVKECWKKILTKWMEELDETD